MIVFFKETYVGTHVVCEMLGVSLEFASSMFVPLPGCLADMPSDE